MSKLITRNRIEFSKRNFFRQNHGFIYGIKPIGNNRVLLQAGPGWSVIGQNTLWAWSFEGDGLPLSKSVMG